MNTSKLVVITAIVFLLAILLLAPTGMDSGVAAIIIMVLVIGVPITVSVIHIINTEKHIIIDRKNNTAILLQRSKTSAAELHCIEVRNYDYKNHDAEIVYTGASSGGIHMGGVHTTKAYTSMTSTGKSDKAYISADCKGESIIEKIVLNPQLLNEAKKDEIIRKFIVNDCIIVENKGKGTKLTSLERAKLSNARERNDLASQYKIVQRARLASYLPTSDIKYIINWVSGK